ncbi:hypothetical protein Godav_027875, partial [Gossypium davidsonii]|nr:hypothetical protein [Gossypium davidsonii]
VVVLIILKIQKTYKLLVINQSDEEKTSTDQDEDIKVTSHNFDEENTSSEDENIDILDPMDTEPTDPYGKRKIDSDIQTDDYLRSYNK